MLAMLREAAKDADIRFQKGWATIHSGSDYRLLNGTVPSANTGIDNSWEKLLNRKKVYVTRLVRPLDSNKNPNQISTATANHRFWVSQFLRPELLPPSNQWATQFWLAPNGDEVAVTSWKSNGFSIYAFDGRSLCIVVRPDESREIFGRSLEQIHRSKETKEGLTTWADRLPVPYQSFIYAEQIYALVSSDSAKSRSIYGVRMDIDDPPVGDLSSGQIYMSKGDAVSGIPALPRVFARDINYWTDGTTAVFVVDKLRKFPSSPTRQQAGQFIGGLEVSDPQAFKRFGPKPFNPADELARYRKELQKTELKEQSNVPEQNTER